MEQIIIVMMDGGLGNQIGQAVFIRFLEKIFGTRCIVDDSAFFSEGGTVDHNGFELDKVFGMEFPFLSTVFDETEWLSMLENKLKGKSIPIQLEEKGFQLSVISETKVSKDYFSREIIFLPNEISELLDLLPNLEGSLYFNGYYINSIYWKLLGEQIWKEFSFPEFGEANTEYAKIIMNCNSVSVHIRRGDFIKVGRDIGPDKYKELISQICDTEENPVFFVFSDDLKWCRENTKEIGLAERNVIFVEGNDVSGTQFNDMHLMSLCKQMVLCDSSFSYWAAMFNKNENLKLYRVYRAQKLFSIIVPCYNVEKYIRECLDSIVNQSISRDELEVILVDDCSTDGTIDILKEYESKYPNLFVLILLDKNGRQGRARNIGMQYAIGKYIDFIDSDDFVRTDMFEILKTIVMRYDVDIVQFRYQIFGDNETIKYEHKNPDELLEGKTFSLVEYGKDRKKYLLSSRYLNESCTQKIYRKKLVCENYLKYSEGVGYEEPMFTYPIKFVAEKIAVLEENLYFYRTNREGTMMHYMNTPETILDHVNVQLDLRKKMEIWDKTKGYEQETELYFIHAFYVEPFYFMKARGWCMPVNLWRLLKKEVFEHAPRYMDNIHLNDPSLREEKKLVDLLGIEEANDEVMQDILTNVSNTLKGF